MMKFRRGQGQTEYIIMVGLVALVLVAAVREFAFRVDEAIEGTGEALEHMDPSAYGLDADGKKLKNPGIEVGFLKDAEGNPTNQKIYKVPLKKGGSWVWEYHDNRAGNGGIIPRDKISFGRNISDAVEGAGG